VKDIEIWAFNKSGDYTVKSGYWLLTNATTNSGVDQRVEDQTVTEMKKLIWKLPTIPKIRMFWWRAVSRALAVAERLTAHGMPVEQTCKLCNQGVETIQHVLFHCSKAQELWREFRLPSDFVFQDVSLIELFGICLKLMVLT